MAWLIPTFELAREIGDRVEIDAATVGELIDVGVARYGEPFRRATLGAVLVVNGRSISVLKGRRTPLAAGDSVWLVKAAAGG